MDTKDLSIEPWYLKTRRWGQTNLTEIDPKHYDSDLWRNQWRKTRVQGVIINAGGIVAYYPSEYHLHYRAEHLHSRDLFGEISKAARSENLAVLSRMDSNRATREMWEANPQWFAIDCEGKPSKIGDRYLTCINGGYYQEFLPDVLREIIKREKPDGFTDNSWSGPGREFICHCDNCARKFHNKTGLSLPRQANWQEHTYRQWIKWSYTCRTDLWDYNNEVTSEAGGENCLWLGMLHGDPIALSKSFRDIKTLGKRSKIVMCDHQARRPKHGFEENGLNGKVLHSMAGVNTVIPESMSMYTRGPKTFRVTSNPPCESQLWMIEAIAGGISPWWHHIGAHHEDRRQYQTAEKIMAWHEDNQQYLYDRQPIATVGLLWSYENIDFYRQNCADMRVAVPYQGFTKALTRARIPYLPVHADDIEQFANTGSLLILPNLAVMSDQQVNAVQRFVEGGGSIVATGQTSLYDSWGDQRQDFALADVFGANATGEHLGSIDPPTSGWNQYSQHSYLRLNNHSNSKYQNPCHPGLNGFEETNILPFGGRIELVSPNQSAETLLTFIPPFPIYPPEFSWMRTQETDIPAMICSTNNSAGKIAYLPADIDRCYATDQLPDHANLLANIVRWAAGDNLPFEITGPGYFDCHLYRQNNRLILHMINLSNARAWPGRVEEFLSVGPVKVRISLPEDIEVNNVLQTVSNRSVDFSTDNRSIEFQVQQITAHEMIVMQ